MKNFKKYHILWLFDQSLLFFVFDDSLFIFLSSMHFQQQKELYINLIKITLQLLFLVQPRIKHAPGNSNILIPTRHEKKYRKISISCSKWGNKVFLKRYLGLVHARWNTKMDLHVFLTQLSVRSMTSDRDK